MRCSVYRGVYCFKITIKLSWKCYLRRIWSRSTTCLNSHKGESLITIRCTMKWSYKVSFYETLKTGSKTIKQTFVCTMAGHWRMSRTNCDLSDRQYATSITKSQSWRHIYKIMKLVLLIDFSEIYNPKCAEEIQAIHFGHNRLLSTMSCTQKLVGN